VEINQIVIVKITTVIEKLLETKWEYYHPMGINCGDCNEFAADVVKKVWRSRIVLIEKIDNSE
jgi:hypothetical protein